MLLGVKVPCSDEATGTIVPSVLRVGMAGCFIGHGVFGIITKAAWVPYFAVGGIGEPLAWQLMPWVGAMDIAIGCLALLWPCRALLLWAVTWTFWTALLRPLSGESTWEFVERAGNYGVPIALLVVAGWRGAPFARLPGSWPAMAVEVRTRLAWTLRFTTAALLAGHAGCGLLLHKAMLGKLYASVYSGAPAALVPGVGAGEFLLAFLVLILPRPGLLLAICLWKLASEALFPLSGAPVWEFVERFGSYAAPLALAILLTRERPAGAFTPTHLPAT